MVSTEIIEFILLILLKKIFDVAYRTDIAEQVAGQEAFDEIIFPQANPGDTEKEMDLDNNESCYHSTTVLPESDSSPLDGKNIFGWK